MTAATTAASPFQQIYEEVEFVAKTHAKTFIGQRFYLTRDLRRTPNPGEKAEVTEIILELQRRIHQLSKKENDLTGAWNSLNKTITLLHFISDLGHQQKLSSLKDLFGVHVKDTFRLSIDYAGHPQSEIPKNLIGYPLRNLFETLPMILSTISALKELTHACSWFAKLSPQCKEGKEKCYPITKVFFSKVPKTIDTSKTDVRKVTSVTLSTMEGVSFVIRWFRKSGPNSMMPKEMLKEEDLKIFKPFLKDKSIEVQALARRYLFSTNEMKKLANWIRLLKTLKIGFKKLKFLTDTLQKHDIKILQPFGALLKLLESKIPLFPRNDSPIPDSQTVSHSSEVLRFITEQVFPLESSINALYEYLYADLNWFLDKKKTKLQPKREFPSLLGLIDRDDLFTPDLCKRISVLSDNNLDAELGNNDSLSKVITESIQELTSGLSLEREKKAKENSSKGTSANTAASQTAAASNSAAIETPEESNAPAAISTAPGAPTVSPSNTMSSILDRIRSSCPFKNGIKCHKRVRNWFDNPEKALADGNHSSKPTHIKRKIQLLHTFSTSMDMFIGSEYCKQTIRAGETQYLLPVQVTILNETFFAVVEYTFTLDGICYHRCISEMQAEEFMLSWESFQYPTLEQSTKSANESASTLTVEDKTKITFQPGLDIFIFENEFMTINLMKQNI